MSNYQYNRAKATVFVSVQAIALIALSGCFGSAPTRPTESFPIYQERIVTRPKTPISETSADPSASNNEAQKPEPQKTSETTDYICQDRRTQSSYSEDLSADCVRRQTMMAYKIFGFNMDPEIPYCILRQESSDPTAIGGPYVLSFNRFAGYPKKGRVYRGIGIAGFTFDTWSDFGTLISNSSSRYEKLQNCLNELSAGTNQPRFYNKVFINKIETKDAELLVNDAKTHPPTDELNPFYRDQAICMSAMKLSTAKPFHSSKKPVYAFKGKGKNRRKVLLTDIELQSRFYGGQYNGGGDPGYGSKIGNCVSEFRDYDNTKNVSPEQVYLRPKSESDFGREPATAASEKSDEGSL
jgi:hypothetical protein